MQNIIPTTSDQPRRFNNHPHFENKGGEVAPTTSPESSNIPAGHRELEARAETTTSAPPVTTEALLGTVKGVAAPTIRDKILAARKTPDLVARLIATRSEQMTLPVSKRPGDGSYWRVRNEGEWDPAATELLLLPRKESGGGPEFLLILPELEPLFNSDPRLRNLVRYHHLAFITDTRGRVGWWAVPSRSENDWHVSARNAMRRLTTEWGMVKSDMAAKGYQLELPVDDLGEPQWPDGSYEDWFMKGLSDKVIDTDDHPVLRELQGRK